MRMCLAELWEMYEQQKIDNVKDNPVSVEENFKIAGEGRKVEAALRMFKGEKEGVVGLKASIELAWLKVKEVLDKKKLDDASIKNIHKVMRLSVRKNRDKVNNQKNKLEYMIVDVLKGIEGTKEKLRKTKEISFEE